MGRLNAMCSYQIKKKTEFLTSFSSFNSEEMALLVKVLLKHNKNKRKQKANKQKYLFVLTTASFSSSRSVPNLLISSLDVSSMRSLFYITTFVALDQATTFKCLHITTKSSNKISFRCCLL